MPNKICKKCDSIYVNMVAAAAFSKSPRRSRGGEAHEDPKSSEYAVDPIDKFLLDKFISKYFIDL
ncbi:MAG: hypothetical protein FD143_3685 [Ignavibacteria bacterium]|nr:MAG: hypothetical protein FD143_3685 [Ignavibacteria bacterium]